MRGASGAGVVSMRTVEVPSNRKRLGLALLVALLVVFTVHLLDCRGSVPNFVKRSGGGTLLDVKPSFSEGEVYERLEAYGESGRSSYFFRDLTVDAVLPLSPLRFLFLVMLAALENLRAGRLTRALLLSVPIAYVVFDFAENATVLALLSRFPERVHFPAIALPYPTTVKRTTSILALVLPLAMFSFAFVQRRLSRTV